MHIVIDDTIYFDAQVGTGAQSMLMHCGLTTHRTEPLGWQQILESQDTI